MKGLLTTKRFPSWSWNGTLIAIPGAFLFSYLILKFLVNYFRVCFSPLQKIPGPNHSFLLGAFLEVQKEPFMAPHKRWCEEFGKDQPFLRYSSLFFTQSLLILDKEVVQLILTTPPGSGPKPRFGKVAVDFLRSRIGDGLVTLEGEDWKRHRRILQPSFQTNFLKESLDETVPPVAGSLIGAWKEAVAAGPREIDAASHLSTVTLDVVGKVLFSHDFQGLQIIQKWAAKRGEFVDNKKNPDESKLDKLDDAFMSALMATLKPSLLSVILAGLGLASLDKYVNPYIRKTRQTLNYAADQVITNASSDMKSKSLLHLMLVAEDPEQQQNTNEDETATSNSTKEYTKRLNRIELRDETKTFLMAGHETTATWIYWSFYALAKHPDVQEKLYQDVIQHAPEGPIRLEHTQQMDYLQAFLQEVLRLYPPAGVLFRTNSRVEEFKGCTIPAGTRLVIPVHILHRHPRYWDDPEAFSPERWIHVSDTERERRRFAFLPFGGGLRNCIGQRFAALEAQLLLAPLVRAFTIRIGASQRHVEHTFTTFVTMKAKPALKIMVQERAESVSG